MNLRKLFGELLNPVFLFDDRRLVENNVIQLSSNMKTHIVNLRNQFAGIGAPLNKNDRKLASLKNKHINQRCFLIGNGPSLKNTNVKLLKEEITFGVNKIYFLFDQMGFIPTYYSVEDQLLTISCHEEINNVSGTVKLFPEDIIRLGIRPDAETILFRRIHKYPDYPSFQSNALKPLYHGGTITYTNMQLAYYMGIREVYLIGMDFDFGSLNKTQENTIIDSNETTHFRAGYHKAGEKWNPPYLDRQLKSFQVAKRFFEEHGGKIYNATIGGKLEVFPRVDYENLF